jgi:hypothetical protein
MFEGFWVLPIGDAKVITKQPPIREIHGAIHRKKRLISISALRDGNAFRADFDRHDVEYGLKDFLERDLLVAFRAFDLDLELKLTLFDLLYVLNLVLERVGAVALWTFEGGGEYRDILLNGLRGSAALGADCMAPGLPAIARTLNGLKGYRGMLEGAMPTGAALYNFDDHQTLRVRTHKTDRIGWLHEMDDTPTATRF